MLPEDCRDQLGQSNRAIVLYPEDEWPFVKLILQLEAYVVGFDGSDGFGNGIDPPVHLEFAQLMGCG